MTQKILLVGERGGQSGAVQEGGSARTHAHTKKHKLVTNKRCVPCSALVHNFFAVKREGVHFYCLLSCYFIITKAYLRKCTNVQLWNG